MLVEGKRPFPVPAKFWSDKNVRNTIDEVLLSKESLDRGIILPEILKRACARDDLSLPLWQLLNLELWFKLFVDRNPSWIDAAQLST
jgi:asparagine synthase (glutamine-hydrolysing)